MATTSYDHDYQQQAARDYAQTALSAATGILGSGWGIRQTPLCPVRLLPGTF